MSLCQIPQKTKRNTYTTYLKFIALFALVVIYTGTHFNHSNLYVTSSI